MKKKNLIQLILLVVILAAVIIGYFVMKSYNKTHTEDATASSAASETYQITKFKAEDATDITVTGSGLNMHLVKLNNKWQNADDNTMKIDADKVSSFLTVFTSLTGTQKITDAKNLSDYGLDKPTATVTITTFNATYQLNLGSHNTIVDCYYLSKDGDSAVYAIGADVNTECTKTIKDFEATDASGSTAATTQSE